MHLELGLRSDHRVLQSPDVQRVRAPGVLLMGRAATLVVATRGRRTAAQHTIASFAALAADRGHTLRAVVVDDAPAPSEDSGGLGTGIELYDMTRRRQLIDRMVEAGADRPLLEHALLDTMGLGHVLGASRNFVQLLVPDSVVIVVDDDIDARMFRPPGASTQPQVRRDDPTRTWFFGDGDELAAVHAPDGDAIESLSAGLAMDVGQHLPRVAASWLGMAGDPGTTNDLHWLAASVESRAQAAWDDATYLRHRASRRTMRTVIRPTLCFGAAWTPAVVAYDHRRVLPPFLPALRGQGLAWGACISGGGAWSLVRMPGALAHRIDAPRSIDAPLRRRATSSLAVAGFVQTVLGAGPMPSHTIEPTSALAEQGGRLLDVAESPARFDQFVTSTIAERSRQLASALRSRLDAFGRMPAAWAADVDATLADVVQVERSAATWVPYDLEAIRENGRETLREICIGYGRLLRGWPELLAIARRVAP